MAAAYSADMGVVRPIPLPTGLRRAGGVAKSGLHLDRGRLTICRMKAVYPPVGSKWKEVDTRVKRTIEVGLTRAGTRHGQHPIRVAVRLCRIGGGEEGAPQAARAESA